MAVNKVGLVSGKIGDRIYRVRYGKQTVYSAPAQYKQSNTEAQMGQRSKWGNIVATYRAMKPFAKQCMELESAGTNPFNRFISVNMQKPEVYITKQISNLGGGVVAPYWVSQGCLDGIGVTCEGSGTVTDIALGALEIGAETTVGEFARTVATLNERYEYGDRILFVLFRQKVDEVTGTPTIRAQMWSVALVKDDPTRLLEVGGTVGFASREGRLALANSDLGDSGFCWIHTRETAGGKLLASPQRLIVSNSLLANYTNEEAKTASMRSYGLKPAAFITPQN